jgi:hypothetical protein
MASSPTFAKITQGTIQGCPCKTQFQETSTFLAGQGIVRSLTRTFFSDATLLGESLVEEDTAIEDRVLKTYAKVLQQFHLVL